MWSKLLMIFILWSTNTFTSSFDLRGVVSGNSMAAVPLGKSLGSGELDVEGICTTHGTNCQNCSHVVTCVSLPMGWLRVPLQQCSEGQTCNAKLGGCSDTPVPECDVTIQNYDHTCEQVGIFPDAYNCRKFHLCSPPEDLPDGKPADHRAALCPRNYGYDAHTAQCSVKLPHGQCTTKPIPDCSQVGQTGVVPASPNHYYVCLVKYGLLVPQVFICPHGWYFWDGFCRPEANVDVEIKEEPAVATEPVIPDNPQATGTTERPTTTKIESFFSTEKAKTNAPDLFLADKFDLTQYENIGVEDIGQNYMFNSFESGSESW